MRQTTVLLAVLLILGAGILAAGCTMPEDNGILPEDGIQPTPVEEETPMETPVETPPGDPADDQAETPVEETPPGDPAGFEQ